MQDARGLDHLHEEGALAPREVVLGADAGEDPVNHPDPGRARRDEAAHLGQDHQQRRLAHEDAFAAHVGPRQDDHLLAFGVEVEVVGREGALAARLEHGMAPLRDVEDTAVVDLRSHVSALVGDLPERGERVQRPDRPCRPQQRRRLGRDGRPDLLEELQLQLCHPLLGPEHAAFVFLELDGNVALGADQGLAPDVLGGHLRHVCIAHLDAVAEDAVEAHAERGDARALPLAPLQSGDPRARLPRPALDLAEIGAPALPDQAALPERERRLVLEGVHEHSMERRQGRDLLAHLREEGR